MCINLYNISILQRSSREKYRDDFNCFTHAGTRCSLYTRGSVHLLIKQSGMVNKVKMKHSWVHFKVEQSYNTKIIYNFHNHQNVIIKLSRFIIHSFRLK